MTFQVNKYKTNKGPVLRQELQVFFSKSAISIETSKYGIRYLIVKTGFESWVSRREMALMHMYL